MPESDIVLRRYPRALNLTEQPYWAPSLPCLAAHMLYRSQSIDQESTDPKSTCTETTSSRIQYTLPSLVVHNRSEAMRRIGLYSQLYSHCLVPQFLNDKGPCSSADDFRDKVVILGSSNRFRGDIHLTPLEEMPGPEVVINAIRSFMLQGRGYQEPGFVAKLVKKCLIAFLCSFIWLVYLVLKKRRESFQHPSDGTPRALHWLTCFKRRVVSALSFGVTIALMAGCAVLLAFRLSGSSPNVDVILPVLAIGMEQYVEMSKDMLSKVEGPIESIAAVWRRKLAKYIR